jgi:hypothetical protein
MKDKEIRYHIILMCREIKQLLKSGEKSAWFSVSYGLCYLSFLYSANKNLPFFLIRKYMLFRIFRGNHYPFNDDLSDPNNELTYENPKRLAFINEWAKKRLPKL